jgi:hypothetical protein
MWNKMGIFLAGLLALVALADPETEALQVSQSYTCEQSEVICALQEPEKRHVEDREVETRSLEVVVVAEGRAPQVIRPLPGSAALTGYAPTVMVRPPATA